MAKLIDLPGSRLGWRQALVLPGEFFAPSIPAVGRLKVWTGSQWVVKPVNAWSGTAWVEQVVKVYEVGSWV